MNKLRAPAVSSRVQRTSAVPVLARSACSKSVMMGTPLVQSPTLSAKPAGLNASLRSTRPVKIVAQAASGGAAAAKPAPKFTWGANMRDLFISIGIGLAMWFIPPPAGVSAKAWHLLSVFTGTIVGIITTPLPLGAVAILGLGAAMATKVLTFAEAFSAFASEIP